MSRRLPQHRYGLRRREQRQLHLLSLIRIYHPIQVQSYLRADHCPSMPLYKPIRLIHREAVLFTGELARWGRSTLDLVQTLQTLQAQKVSLLALNGLQFDLSTPDGKLL
jgi:hypothetical protein